MKKADRDDFEQLLAGFAGQIMRYVDERAGQTEERSDARLDVIQTSIDKLAGRVADDEVERAAIAVQQDRHQVWIEQLADSTGTKLAPAGD